MKEVSGRFYLNKNKIFQLPNKSGVYFLYQKGRILVYIGKALSLLNRIQKHYADKEFTDIGFELCHWSRTRQLENELLNLYEKEHGQLPYYNKIH
jgi:excinuclease UvrABC nuclease subunit